MTCSCRNHSHQKPSLSDRNKREEIQEGASKSAAGNKTNAHLAIRGMTMECCESSTSLPQLPGTLNNQFHSSLILVLCKQEGFLCKKEGLRSASITRGVMIEMK
jgi:hypothetical protein